YAPLLREIDLAVPDVIVHRSGDGAAVGLREAVSRGGQRVQQVAVDSLSEAIDQQAVVDQPSFHHRLDILHVVRVKPFQLADHDIDGLQDLDVKVGQVRVQIGDRH